jgi:hypothetical protein
MPWLNVKPHRVPILLSILLSVGFGCCNRSQTGYILHARTQTRVCVFFPVHLIVFLHPRLQKKARLHFYMGFWPGFVRIIYKLFYGHNMNWLEF